MLQSLGIWFAGSFTSVLKGQYEPLWLVAVVVVLVFFVADRFTVAGLGEEIATNVGLNYRRIVFIGTGLIAIATGIVTVVVGNLPFLGLIVPNIVSMFRGDDLRSNLPWVSLGISVVTVCDIISRIIIRPFEIPVSTILAIVGAVPSPCCCASAAHEPPEPRGRTRHRDDRTTPEAGSLRRVFGGRRIDEFDVADAAPGKDGEAEEHRRPGTGPLRRRPGSATGSSSRSGLRRWASRRLTRLGQPHARLPRLLAHRRISRLSNLAVMLVVAFCQATATVAFRQ